MITEKELNELRPKGLDGALWEELKFCHLPWHQLSVAITVKLPDHVLENYKKMALAARDKRIIILSGPTGTGKTVFGIRYIIRCLYEGIRPPIYLDCYSLRAIIDGRLGIELDYHDTLRCYQTRLKHPFAVERENFVDISELPFHYGVIMIDDFGRQDFEAIWTLIEKTYSSGSRLILTTNIRPEEIDMEFPERVKGRLREIGLLWVRGGEDLRAGR